MPKATDAETTNTPQAPGPPPGGVVAAFWQGLTRPSLASLALALLVPATLFGACALLLTPRRLGTGFHRRVALNRFDDPIFTAAEALALSHRQPARPLVVVFGASSSRNAILGEEPLARWTGQAAGREVKAYNLCSGGQLLWETAILADLLPERFEGVVPIGISPGRLWNYDPNILADWLRTPRLAIGLDHADRLARQWGLEVPPRTGNYFWDYRKLFLPRIEPFLRNLPKRPLIHDTARLGRGRISRSKWDYKMGEPARLRRRYDRNARRALEALAEIVRGLRGRGKVGVALIEEPIHPTYRKEGFGEEFWATYTADIRTFASEHDLPYWDLNLVGNYGDGDFFDTVHFDTAEAQRRWTRALAERCGDLLRSVLESGGAS